MAQLAGQQPDMATIWTNTINNWLALKGHSSWWDRQIPFAPGMRERDTENNVLKTTVAEGAWPRQIWGGEICGEFCSGILSLQVKGFPVEKEFRRVFCRQRRRCNGNPRKITLNFAISKFVSHRNRIPRCPLPVNFFAAGFAANFFAGAHFRWLFFPRQQSAPHRPFMLPSKTRTRPCCPLFKEASKAASSSGNL